MTEPTRTPLGLINGGFLIQQTAAGWQLGIGPDPTTLPADATAQQIVTELNERLQTDPNVQRRCVLGLASDACFFARIDQPEGVDAKDRAAMAFELERWFPLDAESMVADSWIHPASGQIAAVAIESSRYQPLVGALEQAGIEIAAIVPTSFLIARAVDDESDLRSSFELILLAPSSAESIAVDRDGVFQWKRFVDVGDELPQHHAAAGEHGLQPATMIIVGQNEVPIDPQREVIECDQSIEQLIAAGANQVLAAKWGRWPDLRRGDLAPKDPLYAVAGPLRMLALAALLAFATITGAAWFKGQRIERESHAVVEQQRDEFRQSFPDRRVPVMLMRTVRSEHNQMLGSRGRDDSIQLPTPATTVLRDLIIGLEHAQKIGQARYRLIEIEVTDGTCSLTVRAQDARQIGSIAKSLETVGFTVTPPASEQIDPSKDEPLATYQSTILAVWTGNRADDEPGDDS
ncbi:type II secretion system protein GspL [Stieleria sp. TO1_6]|uniref:type II secretion system protein GspL n=1 Tax=Stieleria tagensis TaxID=2956795 RepID=UPI00209A8B73|nr:type II secretion system protein GspL [Stieleria tagensis]MCO8121761.1 type II secretion system protein GspL [Stieleria tagensis]